MYSSRDRKRNTLCDILCANEEGFFSRLKWLDKDKMIVAKKTKIKYVKRNNFSKKKKEIKIKKYTSSLGSTNNF